MRLCPAQQRAHDELVADLPVCSLYLLYSATGMGRTTVLSAVRDTVGGALVTTRQLVDAMHGTHPLALEEAFDRVITDTLCQHEVVLIDDFDVLGSLACCNYAYPRKGWLEASLIALASVAETEGRHLVFATGASQLPDVLRQRCGHAKIPDFTPEDHAFLLSAWLGAEAARAVDCAKLHRFAPRLTAHQLKSVALELRRDGELTTDVFIDRLRRYRLATNVHLDEVQPVGLRDLRGVDDVLESLEANVILPLEDDDLSSSLGLRSKRGVLLVGPPGTGKTTIGRALAHRLRSKFLLIDGTFISDSGDFYQRIHQVFLQARENAPAIVFIDDCDTIFQSGKELGLYRYLLTLLDGLESESAGRVCVMMTAMDVAHLPPALVRSGRIELWLEMHLPDQEARRLILADLLARMPDAIGAVDGPRLAAATEGFTGADLKRLVEDGKLLFAYDRSRDQPVRPATDYFVRAIETVRANRALYERAESAARRQEPRSSLKEAMIGAAGRVRIER